ncbi:MAG: hypothetical protein KME38_02625 [Spirirestis rafaelensis WJT71-NPBG6]|jgi:septal ring factor EnvC (AmiA/AmiB activator)|nr:hypothetical protein [Spirirestis rafaelensis WJT71-NPBG6]
MTDSLNNKDQDYLNRLEKCQRNLQSSSVQAWINGLSISDQNQVKQVQTNLGNCIKTIRNKRLTTILGDLKKEEDIKALQEGINDLEHQINKLSNTISFLNAANKLIKALTKIFSFLPLL